ncbi:hypothetical protein U8Q05_03680 [Rhizobium ruizarguesonis]|nr:hypothetical protein U8Q05_03680 [Rhizobium ruizarguesonis]
MTTDRDILEGYLDMMQARIAAGFEPYLLTFMFKQLKGSERTIALRMTREVERIYSLLLTRVVKRPNKTPDNQKPLMLGCLDWQVPKADRVSFADAMQNDGMHFHANMLMPPIARSMRTLEEIVDRSRLSFEGPNKMLTRLHVEPIKNNARYVFGYGLKSVQRKRLGHDDILVMPKHNSEM